jgi:hypothetical protein
MGGEGGVGEHGQLKRGCDGRLSNETTSAATTKATVMGMVGMKAPPAMVQLGQTTMGQPLQAVVVLIALAMALHPAHVVVVPPTQAVVVQPAHSVMLMPAPSLLLEVVPSLVVQLVWVDPAVVV